MSRGRGLHGVLVLLLLLSPLGQRMAEACFCGVIQPCEAIAWADVVFVGRVVENAQEKADGNLLWNVSRLSVTKTLVGTLGPSVTMVPLGRPDPEDVTASLHQAPHLWTGRNSCDYGFAVGKEYLVYARRAPNGRWTTGLCSGTKPIAEAAADLEYLANHRNGAPRSLQVSIHRIERDQTLRDKTKGVSAAGIPVVITGRSTNITVKTNAEGKVGVQLPSGDFTIRPLVSDKTRVSGGPQRVFLPAQGCVPVMFQLISNGRIEGRVIREDGSAVRLVAVGVIPTDVNSRHISDTLAPRAVTDDRGRFHIEGILPGSYLLAVNPRVRFATQLLYATTYFPGVSERKDARVIEIGDGQRITDATIRVTSMPESTIAGRVVFEDGRPVPRAELRVVVDEYPDQVVALGTTDRQGTFRLPVIRGAAYVVRARTRTGEAETRIYVNESLDGVLLSINR